MKHLNVVVDLQYGSTGKGALAYLLGETIKPDLVVTAWGPNAGHTAVDSLGRRFVHTMLASSMICHSVDAQLIGPGSVINLQALLDECKVARDLVSYKRIIVHPMACVLTLEHAAAERGLVRIGSTMKGTAAALTDKMWRDAARSPLARDMVHTEFAMWRKMFALTGVEFIVDEHAYDAALDSSRSILIEGAQGFSLGLHTGFWPHTTSRDISAAQLMADCRIPFKLARQARVWGTARTFPIRVANRFDAEGHMVGTSGGCYCDQRELDWKVDLGREPELTTVTKLPRRIFTFSYNQVAQATRICGPDFIALTFCDYLAPKAAIGIRLSGRLADMVQEIRDRTTIPVRLMTFGPSIEDTVIVDDSLKTYWLNDTNFRNEVMQESI